MWRGRFTPQQWAGTERRRREFDIPAAPFTVVYRRNGKRRYTESRDDENVVEESMSSRDDETVITPSIPSFLGRYRDIHRYHAALLERYCKEGRCSPKQLRTIEQLMIFGVSAREFARAEGTSVEAISARVRALTRKAPEFVAWWQVLHATRRRSRPVPLTSPGTAAAHGLWLPSARGLELYREEQSTTTDAPDLGQMEGGTANGV
jgi:hypothetical protein